MTRLSMTLRSIAEAREERAKNQEEARRRPFPGLDAMDRQVAELGKTIREASIKRHAPFLTPDEHEAPMPSEAELVAIDRTYALAKANGTLIRHDVRTDLTAQIYAAGLQ